MTLKPPSINSAIYTSAHIIKKAPVYLRIRAKGDEKVLESATYPDGLQNHPMLSLKSGSVHGITENQ